MSALERDPDDRLRVLDADGAVVGDVPDIDDEELIEMYRELRLGRHFDERAVSLQRQGRLGTYAPMAGQEGAQVGAAHALAADDWLFPSYREHLAAYVHGAELRDVLLHWMDDERGNAHDAPVFTPAIPVGTQVLHAVGWAWASAMDDERDVVLANFGDGATSQGDVHEAMNFAGVFDAPVVFLCHNNQWAISTPRERQTASETIAQKATAYGFDGVQVDGMDPLATYAAVAEAVERARDPDGTDSTDGAPRPTLIEAVEYRFGAHTTADDPTVYRDEDEVAAWKERDPIDRLERFLRDTGRLDDERVASIETAVEETVAAAIDAAERVEDEGPEAMFEHVYETPTPALREQRETAAAFADDPFDQ